MYDIQVSFFIFSRTAFIEEELFLFAYGVAIVAWRYVNDDGTTFEEKFISNLYFDYYGCRHGFFICLCK